MPQVSAVGVTAADSNDVMQSSQPVAIRSATAQAVLPTTVAPDTSHPIAHSSQVVTRKQPNRAAGGSEATPHAQRAAVRASAPHEPRTNNATNAMARRSLSPSVQVRRRDRGRSSRQFDHERGRCGGHGREWRASNSRAAGCGARELRSGGSRSEGRGTGQQESPSRPTVGGGKRSRGRSVKQAIEWSSRQAPDPVSPTGALTHLR